jgi:hypothetical protein
LGFEFKVLDLFALGIFYIGSHIYARAILDCSPPIYASHIARMTGMCHIGWGGVLQTLFSILLWHVPPCLASNSFGQDSMELGVVVHTYNPSPREANIGGLWVAGQPGLQSKFEASLGDTCVRGGWGEGVSRLCFKKKIPWVWDFIFIFFWNNEISETPSRCKSRF